MKKVKNDMVDLLEGFICALKIVPMFLILYYNLSGATNNFSIGEYVLRFILMDLGFSFLLGWILYCIKRYFHEKN